MQQEYHNDLPLKKSSIHLLYHSPAGLLARPYLVFCRPGWSPEPRGLVAEAKAIQSCIYVIYIFQSIQLHLF
jgi:hypothetical protein